MKFYDDPSGNTRYDSSPPIFYDGFAPPIERKHKMSEIQLDLSRLTLLELYVLGPKTPSGAVCSCFKPWEA